METKRQLSLAAGAIVGLGALLNGAGCSQVDQSRLGSTGLFQNQLNSTRMARTLTREIDVAEKVMRVGTFDDGSIRYCKVQDAAQELKNLGMPSNRNFTELYEGVPVQIVWDDPNTPQSPDYAEPVQVIAQDGTIGSTRVGSFDATVTRKDLEEAVNTRAKENGIAYRASVLRTDHPMAEVSDTFLGNVICVGQAGGKIVSERLPLPQYGDLHRVVKETGFADNAPYVMVSVEVKNNPEITRLVAVAPTADLLLNRYSMDLGHDDTAYAAAGTNDAEDFITTLDTVGRMVNAVNGDAAAIRQAEEHSHYFGNRDLYLPQRPSSLDKAVDKSGKVSALIGNTNAIKAGLEAGCTTGAK